MSDTTRAKDALLLWGRFFPNVNGKKWQKACRCLPAADGPFGLIIISALCLYRWKIEISNLKLENPIAKNEDRKPNLENRNWKFESKIRSTAGTMVN
jgi:hypothetical protein